jgi:hypothetical protein
MNAIVIDKRMEQKTIARECAADFAGVVEWYRTHYRMTKEEAIAKAQGNAEEDAERILQSPSDQVHWCDIDQVAMKDGQTALNLWEKIKLEALEELQSGHRAAKTLEAGRSTPWERARFFAIQQELSEDWQPRNGMERQLIDTMTIAQSSFFHWMETLTCRTSLDSWQDKKLIEESRWTPPRVSDSEAIEQATTMMDRFNKMFLRALRALRDLRRYCRPVIVQNAGQVNVGTQQVNVGGHVLNTDASEAI